MANKQDWLEFWGLADAQDADEQWARKCAMDDKVSCLYGKEQNMGIIPDIQPYKSMITGEIIHSRTRHKTHLKDHNVVEVGNEIAAATKMPEVKRADFKEEIKKQVYLAKEEQRRKH